MELFDHQRAVHVGFADRARSGSSRIDVGKGVEADRDRRSGAVTEFRTVRAPSSGAAFR